MNTVRTRPLTIAALADQPFFSDMAPATLRRVAAHARRADYAVGERVFAEGGPADRFFLIRHGLVRLDMDVAGRGRVEVEKLGADAALGWSWLMSPYRWHLSATAEGRTSVLVFDAAALRMLMNADPVLGFELLRRLTSVMFERLEATRARLADGASVIVLS